MKCFYLAKQSDLEDSEKNYTERAAFIKGILNDKDGW